MLCWEVPLLLLSSMSALDRASSQITPGACTCTTSSKRKAALAGALARNCPRQSCWGGVVATGDAIRDLGLGIAM
jgi:hypothetical protein